MGNSRRRILFAAGFALVGAVVGVAGTGHAYLRRWKRSLLWLVLTLGTGIILINQYVPDVESVDPFDPGALPTEVTIPVFVILAVSVFDAILIAYLDEREAAMTPGVGEGETDADEGISCPHCGRSTDPALDFCTWCTEPLSTANKNAEITTEQQ